MLRGWGRSWVFLLTFLAANAFAASFPPFKDWKTIDTEHFSVHFHQNNEEIGKKSAGILENAYRELSPKYEWEPWGRTQVILTDHLDDSNGMASTLPYNWILLRVVPPDPESELAAYDDWLKVLITHELTHILHLDANRGFWKPFRWTIGKTSAPAGAAPRWVREGTAVVEETEYTRGGRGRSAYADMLIRTAILNNEFPTIDRADGVHWEWPAGKTPYIWGSHFLQYLIDRFGEEKVQEFHRRTQSNAMMFFGAINGRAKKAFGKSFYKLWKEWKADLEKQYAPWKNDGSFATPSTYLTGKDSYTLATYSPDGKYLAYLSSNPRRAARLVLKDLKTGKEEVLSHQIPTQISFSRDGKKMIFSSLSSYKKYYSYYDLFETDLETKKSKRLTKGERAKYPDIDPSGKKILFVGGIAGGDQLKIYDVETKKISTLLRDVKTHTQFAHPRYSPSGKEFVVVRFQNEKGWELVRYSADGKFIKQITQSRVAVVSRPAWTPRGDAVLFHSDQDGVPNLYRYTLASGSIQKITNVKTGIFQPAISADGKTILARYYNGKGYDVRSVALTGVSLRASAKQSSVSTTDGLLRHSVPRNDTFDVKSYSAFHQPLFLPRYLAPNVVTLDNGFLLFAETGSNDPLFYHSWFGGVTYRTDAKHLGYYGNYSYRRFPTIITAGIIDYAADLGTLSFTNGNSYHYFEERRRNYVSVSPPFFPSQAINFAYFYEDRMPITNLLAAEAAALNLNGYAGFQATYGFGKGEAYPASISPIEKGTRLQLVGTMTDARFGSAERNEQKIFSGDLRKFFSLGNRHVLALRAGGGMAKGDRMNPRTFSLGGSLGEGVLANGGGSRYFPLRGLPVGTLVRDNILLMSAEYRLPLFSPQRGIGTWPVFVNDIHWAFFTDYGDAWDSRDTTTRDGFKDFFDDFLMSIGAEGRANFVFGHGLPVTGRAGYGIVVVNRKRFGNLQDPLLGNRAKNGIFYLQFGTSF
ncbi:MAG: DPP IV N-terminal domain-containing protein [Deltaproteobacteria bacterium]|nr:DPP IV N-terminal domain-containing protein [Deltaproteobacteria bacterium]